MHSDADKQGLVQGMVTGMRGLCNGLGPAMFGLIFYLFHVDLNEDSTKLRESRGPASSVHGDNNTAGQIFESMQPSDLKRICCENHVTPSLVTWVVQSLTCDCVWCVVGCDQTHTHTVDIGNHNSTGELLVPGPPFVFGEWQYLYPMGPRPWGPAYAPPPLEDSQVCQWRYTTRLSALRNTTGSVLCPLWWTTRPCSSAPTTAGPTCF
uniref:(California timema) hypothetical protein n=1 Tax=Timema californicum TaxID=61474 RepID=A0A7R9JHK7_TIMCA|nr:unnamed protein product [Timema californicum]